MDHRDVREWLDAAWNEAIRESVIDPDPEVDALVNSDVSSIRHALVTQMLGKIADPTRSLMALQPAAPFPDIPAKQTTDSLTQGRPSAPSLD